MSLAIAAALLCQLPAPPPPPVTTINVWGDCYTFNDGTNRLVVIVHVEGWTAEPGSVKEWFSVDGPDWWPVGEDLIQPGDYLEGGFVILDDWRRDRIIADGGFFAVGQLFDAEGELIEGAARWVPYVAL